MSRARALTPTSFSSLPIPRHYTRQLLLFLFFPFQKSTMRPRPLLLLYILSAACAAAAAAAAVDEKNVLLDFKNSLQTTVGSGTVFRTWSLSAASPCNFSGIACTEAGSVSSIDLKDLGISGTIPFNSLCSLPSLSSLSLGSNRFSGPISAELRNCTHLLHLDLAFNSLVGEVPDISPLASLLVLNLTQNLLSGPFPWSSLANLTNLESLSLGDNFFDPSPFPTVLTKLTNLYWLYISVCNLHGDVPPAIGNLTRLVNLEFADNFLSGEIPSEVTKLTRLWQLELYNNSFTGKLPAGFGNLSNLAFFDASMNLLTGDLSELRYLNKLVSLQLYYNNFYGEIPTEFGDFRNLVNLSLYSNQLTGPIPAKIGSWAEFNFIDVSTNFLTGTIPPDMCRLGTMQKLLLLENRLSGEIPSTYANCSTLIRFRVSNNSLSGVVPVGIWGLPNVNIIDLELNQLEGQITKEIGMAKSLFQLYIAWNRFSGEIPPEISGALSLVTIHATSNQLIGQIPSSIGKLKNLSSLNLDNNQFAGEIPDTIGSCSALNSINLAGNSLSGPIPSTIGFLPNLNTLNFSDNQFSGVIPESLSLLKLSSLDLSNNFFTGKIPVQLMINAYKDSFTGNPGLCGDNVGYLRQCPSSSGRDNLHVVLISILISVALLLASVRLLIYFRKRRYSPDGSDLRHSQDSWHIKSFGVLTINEQEVINSIQQENLIGKGGSGEVYQVVLGSGNIVAVKHIWNSPDTGTHFSDGSSMLRRRPSKRSREFDAEVGTLSTIRHMNVVKLYCSITGEDSCLLVYEYLPNGSLWERLHSPAAGKKFGGLDWETRYEIALGSARGLEYLHHGCDRPILHRDVKSSNILLDEEFRPRIADFGLAKILHPSSASNTSTHLIHGTHGYIAPEYAYTWRVDEKSDVYSFGVVLLELVTGRRPVEVDYGEDKDIVQWVAGRFMRRDVLDLVDERIQMEADRAEAVRVLRIAVLCTTKLPATRPPMRVVVHMLEEVAAYRNSTVASGNKKGAGAADENKEGAEIKGVGLAQVA